MVNFTSPLHPYDSVPCERMLSESIKQPDERFFAARLLLQFFELSHQHDVCRIGIFFAPPMTNMELK